MRYFFTTAVCIIVLISGCTSNTLAPVRKAGPLINNEYYIVQKGDTLFSIAFRYGVDFKTLAHINKLDSSYTIFPGQKIFFKNTNSVVKKKSSKPRNRRSTIKTSKPKTASTKSSAATTNLSDTKGAAKSSVKPQKQSSAKLKWRWPLKGKILEKYSLKFNGNKGIDIAAKKGQTVSAASAGIVVYCGTGLRGYGRLVIIKHSEDYLSAYAHNSKILVKEQQQVVQGQKIAVSGSSGTNQTKLHFEIRYKGKPVNPLQYLPKQ